VKLDVLLEEVLPHPVDAVWGALTDADAISGWLMATSNFRPRVGTRFRLKTERLSSDGWIRAEVLEIDPPRRMVWSWSPDEASLPTTVTFELIPEDDGTRLRLTHVGEIDLHVGELLIDGWPSRIELLRKSVEERRSS
jgi:uncharacterized protein YndB with AHSA1/START domain